jgi:hydrogenase expression/formation protein HypC
MCLGVPLKIIKIIDQNNAIAELGYGNTLNINISLTPEAKEGDYVMVHAGFAISILNTQDAIDLLQVIQELKNDKLKNDNIKFHQTNLI